MRAEIPEVGWLQAEHDIQGQILLAGRKGTEWPVAFLAAALGFVMILAIANDGRTPHGRLFTGYVSKHFYQNFSIIPPLLVRNSIDEFTDTSIVLLGFEFGHTFLFSILQQYITTSHSVSQEYTFANDS